MTKISEARERYEEKVCKDYLGIPESYCTDEFSKLISNMKAGIMAVKGSSSGDPEKISTSITVDEEPYRKFKGKAFRHGYTVSEVLGQLMRDFVNVERIQKGVLEALKE